MSAPTTIRRYGFVTLLSATLALAACDAPSTDGADLLEQPDSPVDVQALLSSAGGDGNELRLLNAARDGFVIYENGEADYFGFRRRGNDALRTSVTTFEGNEVCLESVDSWSGVCIELWQKADGRVEVRYKFGNGHGSRYIARGMSMTAPATSEVGS